MSLQIIYEEAPIWRPAACTVEQKLTKYLAGGHEEEEDWTFATADTQYMSHGFHPYPARMIPQIARRLIRRYALSREDVILDPFMGSGGVLVEAMLNGNRSVGVDINPLAVLIARVKTTPIEPNVLVKWSDKLLLQLPEKLRDTFDVPRIRNLDFWFKPQVIKQLAVIRNEIETLAGPPEVLDFFRVCFSLAVRKASNIKNGEYKLYRKQGKELQQFSPDAIGAFRTVLKNNIANMRAFWSAVKELDVVPECYPLKGDTKKLLSIDPERLGRESISLVVTSPPYGDSHTTVAYGQFSRYSALWLGLQETEVMATDDRGLGGTVLEEEKDLGSGVLRSTLQEVRERDPYRAKQVYAFFHDADACLSQIAQVLKKGRSHCCFVTGNRTVRRVLIPTDLILIELAAKYGFRHLETKYRDIPTKAIPWVNAPENISGLTSPTINRESIVIWGY